MFASKLSHRDRKPKYSSKFWTKDGGDGRWCPLTPFPFLAPWPSRPPAIETPPRPVPAQWDPHFMTQERIMFSNPSLSELRLSPAATWAIPRHRLSLCPCTAPPSCSLHPSSSCHFWVLDHFCSNLSQLFHLCWITEIALVMRLYLATYNTSSSCRFWVLRHHAQSLQGPSFHDPGTHHALKSHPE